MEWEQKQNRPLGTELTNEPKRPAAAPTRTSSFIRAGQVCLHAELSQMRLAATVRPMTTPPDRDARVPTSDTPPFVPGGTREKVVMRIGGDLDRIPSSEASVSPRQHAK